MNTVELVGFLGGLFFVISALPLGYRALRYKQADLPWLTIGLVICGASTMFVYGALLGSRPLMFDMSVTASCWICVAYTKITTGRGAYRG